MDCATYPQFLLHQTSTPCCPVTRTPWMGLTPSTPSTAPAKTTSPTLRRGTSVQLLFSWLMLRCCWQILLLSNSKIMIPIRFTLYLNVMHFLPWCLGCFQAFVELHWHPGSRHHPSELQDVFWGASVFFWQPWVSQSWYCWLGHLERTQEQKVQEVNLYRPTECPINTNNTWNIFSSIYLKARRDEPSSTGV